MSKKKDKRTRELKRRRRKAARGTHFYGTHKDARRAMQPRTGHWGLPSGNPWMDSDMMLSQVLPVLMGAKRSK